MQLSFHPAPGLGELVPGTFDVPMNPIRAANGDVVWVPGANVKYVPRMGDLLNAYYSVPQNPLKRGCGMGCGCAGSYNYDAGMGALDLSAAWNSVTSTVGSAWDTAKSAIGSTGINPWVIGGAVAVAALLLFRPGGSEYSRAMASARSKYREEVGRIRARYPRVSGRARRAIEAF